MERVGLLTMPDYGLHNDDIRYFKMDSVIRGRGADRLKYLDLEGRWVLSGRKSIPFISQAFRHLESLNDATLAFRDIKEEPLNAIGMVGWTRSSSVEQPKTEKKPKKFEAPPVFVAEEVPPSPREPVPHRSYGYGPAHEKRRLSVSSRSRSASPRAQSPYPEYDKYAKYQRKDSISSLGGGRANDGGYASGAPSPLPTNDEDGWVPPHRTQALSSRPSSRSRKLYDNEYDPEYVKKANQKSNDQQRLQINTTLGQVGRKTRAPGSLSSVGSIGSEQGSPVSGRDEVVLIQYEMRAGGQRTTRAH